METAKIIDRMAEIKKTQSELNEEYSSLQSQLQVTGETDLENTKYKSISYSGTTGKATVIIADKVSTILPSLFEEMFGKAYKDLVNVSEKIELTTEGKRIVAALWNRAYCEGSVENIVNSLECDDKAKKSLLKKLNGKNYETDKKNLMKIGNLSEEDAKDNAYLVSEIIAFNKIQSIIKLNNDGVFSKEALERLLLNVNAAVCVEQSTKIEIESIVA